MSHEALGIKSAEGVFAGEHALRHVAHVALLEPAEAGDAGTETLAFDRLRTSAYERMGQEVAARLAADPEPSTDERLMGTYVEALEPQVRSAIVTMRDKGYNTTASGFHNTDDDWRVLGIDNPLRTYDPLNRRGQLARFREPLDLSEETRERLSRLDAETIEDPDAVGKVAVIGFTPGTPDMGEIEAQWKAIAEALPDTGIPAGPRMGSVEATGFGIYCPPDVNWPKDQFNASMAPVIVGRVAPPGIPGGGLSGTAGGE